MSDKETAEELNIRFRIGKYGVQFLPKAPGGRIYRLMSIIPLDGWITDPDSDLEVIGNIYENKELLK